MSTYDTLQKANNKGADQTARMRRLVCACVVRKPPKTGFLATAPVLFVLCACDDCSKIHFLFITIQLASLTFQSDSSMTQQQQNPR